MDASLVAIGTKADTTNALSISNNHQANYSITSHRSSEAEGDQTERVISERVPASVGEARAPGMSEPREPSTIPQVFMARSDIDQVSS